MSEQDERSALVALTERQLRWLAIVLAEMRAKCEEIGAKKWQGEPLSLARSVERQLLVGLIAVQNQEDDTDPT